MYEVGNDSILQLNYFIMNLQYNNAARELFLFNYMYWDYCVTYQFCVVAVYSCF